MTISSVVDPKVKFLEPASIHVPIQGPLRTPKNLFLNARIQLEIGASVSQVLKLPRPFGPRITNVSSDLRL